MTVIHRTIIPGVHELWATVIPEAALDEIASFLQLNDTVSSKGVTLWLSEVLFTQLMEMIREKGKDTDVANLLTQAQITGVEAEALIMSAKNVQANSMVSLLKIQKSENGVSPMPEESLSLLKSAHDLWLLQTVEKSASRFSMEQITGDRAKAEIGRLLGL